jgi:hypothetical protein
MTPRDRAAERRNNLETAAPSGDFQTGKWDPAGTAAGSGPKPRRKPARRHPPYRCAGLAAAFESVMPFCIEDPGAPKNGSAMLGIVVTQP